jgi:hypothetical protein
MGEVNFSDDFPFTQRLLIFIFEGHQMKPGKILLVTQYKK